MTGFGTGAKRSVPTIVMSMDRYVSGDHTDNGVFCAASMRHKKEISPGDLISVWLLSRATIPIHCRRMWPESGWMRSVTLKSNITSTLFWPFLCPGNRESSLFTATPERGDKLFGVKSRRLNFTSFTRAACEFAMSSLESNPTAPRTDKFKFS